MLTDDWVVFADPDGVHYVACDQDGRWVRWPAVADGWRSRDSCDPTYAEQCHELLYPHSMLALRLSGVEA